MYVFYLIYIVKLINCKNIPTITPIKYNIPIILILSLIFLLTLKRTSKPIPAFTRSPEISIATLIIFSTYNCESKTDAAQFGINPINPATSGPSIFVL